MAAQTRNPYLTAVVADARGEIFELPGYAAVGMAGDDLAPLTLPKTVPMPHGGELMYLPDRRPVVWDVADGRLRELAENPYVPGEPVRPVAAFNSPGYVLSRVCAFREDPGAGPLPLFSYGAVGWHRRGFRTAVIRVDDEPRQDLRRMPPDRVASGVRRMRRTLPDNRLRAHLENCALVYGCPAGKNFFLGRYEAPLPASPACNARCLGCLSLQGESGIPHSQNRITFTPTPVEIAGVALVHLRRVKRAVVSFGQGCEGDPLMVADTLEAAIRLIRAETDRGTINLNTNGSLPSAAAALFDAGLDAVRISMNSVRKTSYEAYFRPRGYRFEDVLRTIDTALCRGRFAAVNYLNCPGVTDAPEEADALDRFLEDHPVSMIQWRNLNFDPVRYRSAMESTGPLGPPLGMKVLLDRVRRSHPRVRFGYFNPPKESFEERAAP